MQKTFSNPCVRCGTERIVSHVWKERVDTATITTTETICPNPECQKRVDSDNKKQKDKNVAIRARTERRFHHRRSV